MTRQEAIERGAFAIWMEFVRSTFRKLYRDEDGRMQEETQDEAWLRRWRETPELVKARYRNEAEACLKAVGVIR